MTVTLLGLKEYGEGDKLVGVVKTILSKQMYSWGRNNSLSYTVRVKRFFANKRKFLLQFCFCALSSLRPSVKTEPAEIFTLSYYPSNQKRLVLTFGIFLIIKNETKWIVCVNYNN